MSRSDPPGPCAGTVVSAFGWLAFTSAGCPVTDEDDFPLLSDGLTSDEVWALVGYFWLDPWSLAFTPSAVPLSADGVARSLDLAGDFAPFTSLFSVIISMFSYEVAIKIKIIITDIWEAFKPSGI